MRFDKGVFRRKPFRSRVSPEVQHALATREGQARRSEGSPFFQPCSAVVWKRIVSHIKKESQAFYVALRGAWLSGPCRGATRGSLLSLGTEGLPEPPGPPVPAPSPFWLHLRPSRVPGIWRLPMVATEARRKAEPWPEGKVAKASRAPFVGCCKLRRRNGSSSQLIQNTYIILNVNYPGLVRLRPIFGMDHASLCPPSAPFDPPTDPTPIRTSNDEWGGGKWMDLSTAYPASMKVMKGEGGSASPLHVKSRLTSRTGSGPPSAIHSLRQQLGSSSLDFPQVQSASPVDPDVPHARDLLERNTHHPLKLISSETNNLVRPHAARGSSVASWECHP